MSNALTPDATVHASTRRRRVSVALLAVWAAVLVAGFAVVFTLGSPFPNTNEQRTDAYAPLALPVTEEDAIAAAEAIVKLDYSSYADATRTVKHGTSQGEEIWTITYARTNPTAGVRITVSGSTGEIRAASFP